MNEINISNMDLNLLKVFEAIFDEQSASRAAIRLRLTQSAVSAALRRLREIYQDPLFVRTGRGLQPTPRAYELKPFISDALNQCRQSLSLNLNPSTTTRTITVGMSDDFEIAMASTLIEQAKIYAPNMRFVFKQTHSHIVSDMLMQYELDVAVTAGGFSYQSIRKEKIGVGTYACLVHKDTFTENTITLDEYVTKPHLLISHGGYVGVVDEILSDMNMSRTVAVSTTHFAAIPWLMQSPQLIATLPKHAALAIAQRCWDLSCIPCPIVLPEYSIELSVRTTAQHDSAIDLATQLIKSALSFSSE